MFEPDDENGFRPPKPIGVYNGFGNMLNGLFGSNEKRPDEENEGEFGFD